MFTSSKEHGLLAAIKLLNIRLALAFRLEAMPTFPTLR